MRMPIKWNEWTLIKEYKHYGLYTNGMWRECFSRFDVGMIEHRNKRGEVLLFNTFVGGKYGKK